MSHTATCANTEEVWIYPEPTVDLSDTLTQLISYSLKGIYRLFGLNWFTNKTFFFPDHMLILCRSTCSHYLNKVHAVMMAISQVGIWVNLTFQSLLQQVTPSAGAHTSLLNSPECPHESGSDKNLISLHHLHRCQEKPTAQGFLSEWSTAYKSTQVLCCSLPVHASARAPATMSEINALTLYPGLVWGQVDSQESVHHLGVSQCSSQEERKVLFELTRSALPSTTHGRFLQDAP